MYRYSQRGECVPKQIMIKDEIYERLLRIKGNRSFSEVIEYLLDKVVPKSKEELLINEINEFARKMQREDIENYYIYELIRVALIMLIKGNVETAIKMLNKCLEVLSTKSHK